MLKQIRSNALVEAVRRAAAGQSLLDPAGPRACWSAFATAGLTSRVSSPPLPRGEREILSLIAEGLTNRQIGQRLYRRRRR